jgi:hypothetical protein
MSIELQKAIHNILVKDFSKAMGFNEETGLLPNSKKRFSGMPFIGNDYGKFSPKILIVGEDIGCDERRRDNTYHNFDTKRECCIRTSKREYRAHLCGTYMTALYLLKEVAPFNSMWQENFSDKTATLALKTLNTEQIRQIANAIALTNLHKFVTKGRTNRSGDKDRKWIDHDKEFTTFIEEVKCFAPDIVVIQRIGLLSEDDLKRIRQIVGQVYTLPHPSSGARERGGCNVQKYIIEYLK